MLSVIWAPGTEKKVLYLPCTNRMSGELPTPRSGLGMRQNACSAGIESSECRLLAIIHPIRQGRCLRHRFHDGGLESSRKRIDADAVTGGRRGTCLKISHGPIDACLPMCAARGSRGAIAGKSKSKCRVECSVVLSRSCRLPAAPRCMI
jgi:hypothetical protein